MGSKRSDFGDGASPGKIFIGGLAKDTTIDTFVNYFGKYGEITDSVIMKDRHTGRPRGFGFITYSDPSAVDTVIAETHVINGKQVEIKRTIPKGSGDSKDFKTKKVLVGGIPTSVTGDEFKIFFSKFGKVVEHEVILDHVTKRSRGFGFIIFENEQVVDRLLSDGNMIDMSGAQVEVKKAEPKKPSNPTPAYASDSRARAYGDSYSGFGSSYRGYGSDSFGPAPYRSIGPGHDDRFSDYGYGENDFAGRYGDYGSTEFGYRVDGPRGYPSRFCSYGAGFGVGAYGSGLGTYGRGGGGYESYGSYGPGLGAGYESGPGAGYGEARGRGMYRGRAGYSGSSRFHPYAR